MSKYGFLSILETELEQHFNYDFAMDWDKKNHAVEVSFILEAGLPDGVSLAELEGEEAVALEEFILFYNPLKSQFDAEDYLVALPFDPKKGLSREFLTYFAQFLQTTADQGLSDLLDFLTDETANDFAISWDAQAFEHGRADVVETDFHPYPRY